MRVRSTFVLEITTVLTVMPTELIVTEKAEAEETILAREVLNKISSCEGVAFSIEELV